jgi:hypothetical protein
LTAGAIGITIDHSVTSEPAAIWTELPDVLLRAAALAAREGGRQADPLAGVVLTDESVDRLLSLEAGRSADLSADADVDLARKRFRAALEAPSTFSQLVQAAQLDEDEAEIFALCCAVEADADRQRLVAYCNDDVTLRRPTLALLDELFGPGHPGADALSPEGGLRRARLVQLTEDRPWADRQVVVQEVVLWALRGMPSYDKALPPGFEVIVDDPADDDGAGADLVFAVSVDRLRGLQAAVRSSSADAFLVVDPPADEVARDAVIRQATVMGTGVLLRVESLSLELRQLIERSDHLAWAVVSPNELALEEMPRRRWVEVRADDPAATEEEFSSVFDDVSPEGHRVSAHQLQMAAMAAAGIGDSQAALRRLASGPLEKLARRIRPRAVWDDLVLPEADLSRLRALPARYRNRRVVHGEWGLAEFPSPGLVVMFSGPSGTGKTMTAEILAGELGVDLFKVDLSSIVSKYIGETEKNLEQIFSAAASGDLVLLFDEADALFGKRSEVSDARDRYANIEVSYLLQRLETFDGFVVMTTNFQRNVDAAFLRRVHLVLQFPSPEAPYRERIWRRVLAEAPLGDLDLSFVSERFDLTGGSIRNAALTAAFTAAAEDGPVEMRHVVTAVALEMRKLGRLCTEGDFGSWYPLVTEA